jgi:predicted neutral ceramidase superfamily lipid hydrolase
MLLLVVMAIVLISIIPMIVEVVKERKRHTPVYITQLIAGFYATG